jgi:hypothetical protein
MKNTPLAENITELKEALDDYLSARVNLAKVMLLEKISKTGTYFFTVVTSLVVLASMLLLVVFAFSFWYGQVCGEIYHGFLISAAAYLVIGVFILIFRRQIFSNNIIRNISKVLFSDDEE